MSEQPSTVGDAPAINGRVYRFPKMGVGTDDNERPTIQIERGQIPRMTRETIAALGSNDCNIFQRMKELVIIAREPERAEEYEHDERHGSDIVTRPGTPSIHTIGLASLTERAALAANWIKWDPKAGIKVGKAAPTGDMVPADPDTKVLAAVMGRVGDWPGIRPVRGIIESPALAPSGRVISEPGYDHETAFVLLPSFAMEPIPERPTQAQAAIELRWIWTNLYGDFPFADVGESSPLDVGRAAQFERARTVPGAFAGLAAILTILARPAILGAVPGIIFEAPTQGSGKSLGMHVVSMVATGRPAGVMTFPMRNGEPIEEELEKVLSAYALGGASVIAFDNITGNLAGAALDKVLSAVKTIDLRPLGESKVKTMPWSAITLFSGNNMTMSADVARRTMVSRIVSSLESPSKRPASDFMHPNLLNWIEATRPRLVRSLLLILRAFWVVQDKPDCGIRGSFEAWSQIIPGAIVYAGGPNVIKAWAEETGGGAGGDELSAAHSVLMASWPFDGESKASDVLAFAFKDEFAISRGDMAPDGKEDLREAIRMLCKSPIHVPKAGPFGISMSKIREKIRDGKSIERRIDRKGVALWTIKGRKPGTVPPQTQPAPVVTPSAAEPVAPPSPAPVVTCGACRQPRGYGPGRCNPCVCGGCCDVPAGIDGVCGCPPGAG